MRFSIILPGSIINTKSDRYYVLEQNGQSLYCLLMKRRVKARNAVTFYIQDVGFVVFSDALTIPLGQVKNVESLICSMVECKLLERYRLYIDQRIKSMARIGGVIPIQHQHKEAARNNKKLIWHGKEGLPVYTMIVNGGRVSPR